MNTERTPETRHASGSVWFTVLLVIALIAMGARLFKDPSSPVMHPTQQVVGMTVFESITGVQAANLQAAPRASSPQAVQCAEVHLNVERYLAAGLEFTDMYSRDTAPGDRALAKYWESYPALVECATAGHPVPESLVNALETLAIRLEVMDFEER